jgi:dipeptidyl aminopeptidase/acylaminoacyl peptidase
MYRHWDTWVDGNYNHIFYATYSAGKISDGKDMMANEPFDCPTKPDGDASDVNWDGSGKGIYYVCKKKSGTAYALSTNSEIYYFDLQTGKTTNVTEAYKGYDTNPAVSPDGKLLAWTSMATDGYEADKNDVMIRDISSGKMWNLTKDWDETVNSFRWSDDGKKIYFLAYKNATEQVLELSLENNPDNNSAKNIKQLTQGDHDLNAIVSQSGNNLVCAMTDMNHSTELVRVNLSAGDVGSITTVNKNIYDGIPMSKIDKIWVNTTDHKKMLTWIIYPPNYDQNKKYPVLLFCQGGPQVCLSQFYSFRWNFQLMAANGYIVVAPCRRGMPGFGVEWNREISGDWGGQCIQDYLSAVDSVRKWPSVDQNRIGCVGASFGGYSAYMLEGLNGGRFKTFIAHCGTFDLTAWYNSTEEMWFANYDLGGSWWKTPQPKAYTTFNPLSYIDKWKAPMMVIEGELDFRIPYTQGLEAFQILQLKGIKSRLLVFTDEGHWVLKPQDGLLWQREFFRWLNETL